MSYEHTQPGRFHYLLVFLGMGLLALGFLGLEEELPARIVIAAGGIFLVLTTLFAQLTVRGRSDHLELAFGPLALIRRRVPYAEIRSVKSARSALIDGWGIHWIPGRGTTWNIWGRGCVELELEGNRRLRVGTDEPATLARFLADRLG